MKNFDADSYLGWQWAMEHPIMHTLIEVMTGTPMIAFAIGFGAVQGYVKYQKYKKR